MAAIPGIIFDAVEPPNPYLNYRSWVRLPGDSQQENVFPPEQNTARWAPRVLNVVGTTAQPGSPLHRHEHKSPPERTQGGRALLPPFSVSLTISVVQDMAKAVVTQSFRNDAPVDILKGTYQFPLPHESSIVDFRCQIGEDKTLQGQVKPREAARKEFERSVRQGRSAGLVEQNTPEIFSTVIGKIPAHTIVAVKVSFIFFLKHRLSEDTTTTILTIPTYIAPRYGDPGFELGETGPQPERSLSLDIDILTYNKICDVRSDTHQVVVQRGVRQGHCQSWADFVAGTPSSQSTPFSVRLDGDEACLDRDFVLSISAYPSIDEEQPNASLEVHPELEGHVAMMVEIPPRFMLRTQSLIKDTEIVFVADRSGSMADKIPGLKSSMEFFLRGLPQTRFNIYCFGSKYESLWEISRLYGEDTLNEAIHYVSRFTNDMGGTDLLPALQSVVGGRGQGSLDVIVLTDGETWRSEETIEFVRRTRIASEGTVRFFALGIGNAVSHQLVEGIAKAGGGYAEVIPTATGNGWEAHMVAVLKAAMTGHITDPAIEVEGVDLYQRGDKATPPKIQMSPGDISSLSPFHRNRIFVLAEANQLTADSHIRIKTRPIGGQETITRIPVHVLKERDSTIHKFAAKAILGDLESGDSWIQRDRRIPRNTSQEQEMIKSEGERLGCQWSLVSKWTSFVAVETLQGSEGMVSSRITHPTSLSSDLATLGIEQADEDDFILLSSTSNIFQGPRPANYPTRYRWCRLSRSQGQLHRLARSQKTARCTSSLPRDPGLQRAEDFIRQILPFQKAAGAFEVPENEAKKYLNTHTNKVVEVLLMNGAEFSLAVTVALVVRIKNDFDRCKDLWLRMVEKASDSIQFSIKGLDNPQLVAVVEEFLTGDL